MNAPFDTRVSYGFSPSVAMSDPELFACIAAEEARQENTVELIASENIASAAVRAAQGSVLTNKYAEGTPGKRYYGGCGPSDAVERLAQKRACALFGCSWANVQPHSGSQANQAVFLSLLSPGDTLLGMGLDAGGHLTHGAKPNLSGKWFNAVSYGVSPTTQHVDMDALETLVQEHRPRLLIAGGSAIPRHLDFARFRALADSVGAWLLVDMAHFAGLVAAGLYPSPFPHAHVVTSTTHKTLRGPRGGLILTNDEGLAKAFDSAVFPGLQGGPLMHVIAGKAVAFGEALEPSFKTYQQRVVAHAKVLGNRLKEGGVSLVTGGTDTHLILADLRSLGVTGKDAERFLEAAGITCNKNSIPFDTKGPFLTSGIRLGTPAGTSRGFDEEAFDAIGGWIVDVLHALSRRGNGADGEKTLDACVATVRVATQALCERFPLNVS